jgi:hypothetical protein
MTTLTGYKVAKLTNQALADQGLAPIPPQMVYTYIRKGYIRSVVIGGQRLVTRRDANKWIRAHVLGAIERNQQALADLDLEASANDPANA